MKALSLLDFRLCFTRVAVCLTVSIFVTELSRRCLGSVDKTRSCAGKTVASCLLSRRPGEFNYGKTTRKYSPAYALRSSKAPTGFYANAAKNDSPEAASGVQGRRPMAYARKPVGRVAGSEGKICPPGISHFPEAA
jgi:hypothetical protein